VPVRSRSAVQHSHGPSRFAKLCGVAPLPASSGLNQRHRLNRGGDRQANSALHMAVVCRLQYDEAARKYLERRTAEGKSKMEIIRCLKWYVAREAYYLIRQDSNPTRTLQGT
jgi:transposase